MIEQELRARLGAELNARADSIKLTPIEQPYFAALEKALGEMPDARKGAAIKEVRAHLWAMVEAKRMDGASEADAWQRATAEFGEPAKFGRALWLQWVKSGHVEVEGAPLTKWQKIRNWLLLVGSTALACATMGAEFTDRGIVFGLAAGLVYASMMVQGLDISVLNPRRSGDWGIRSLIDMSPVLLFGFSVLTINSWRETPYALIRDTFLIGATLIWFVHSLYEWKRDLGLLPWKSSQRYVKNPIAAEQNHRFWPVMLLFSFASVLGVAAVWWGIQTFGLLLALVAGFLLVGSALLVGKRLIH